MDDVERTEEPPSWAGAAGYQPYSELPPHAPMPGAPPYPASIDHPPPPVGATSGTRFGRALAAAAVWAVVNLVLVLIVAGPLPSAYSAARTLLALLVTTLLGGAGTWFLSRRRAWPFWRLVLVAAPLYVVLAVLFAAVY